MFFRISSVIHDHTQIQISNEEEYNQENTFTIITGRNASGKSRLLRKIVSNYIFSEKYDLLEASDVMPNFYSETRPSCVIAVSTGNRDRFPRPTDKISESGIDYHYIGNFIQRTRSTQNNISTLSSSFLQVIRNLAKEDINAVQLANAFRLLGYSPSFNIHLDESQEIKKERASLNNYEQPQKFDLRTPIKKLDLLHGIIKNSKNSPFSVHLNLLHRSGHSTESKELGLISELVESGYLKVINTELFTFDNKEKRRLNEASSGQQCMIQMLIGIAASIKNNALICIDEPEISLHPEWQSKVISLFQDLFTAYTGCHFIIATHSPQVVSGLKSTNSQVVNLESFKSFTPSFYAEKSADFQLAQIFEEPGYRNEFLLRSSLKLLTKLSKRQEIDTHDKNMIKSLQLIKDRLQDNDPTSHLIDQITMLESE